MKQKADPVVHSDALGALVALAILAGGALAGGCGGPRGRATGGGRSSGNTGGASSSGASQGGQSAGGGGSSGSASGGADQGVVSFDGSWDADPVQGGFRDIQVVTPTKLQKDASTPTWPGRGAARVEVDPGDDRLNLDENTERAEVLAMQDASMMPLAEDASSGVQFYALSYRFPSDWAGTQIPGNDSSWSIVFQLVDARPARGSTT